MLHTGDYISNPKAADGRKLQECVQKVVSESVRIILDVKQRSPKLDDVTKTAANKKAETENYMNAYRGIKNEINKDILDEDIFQLVINSLQRLKDLKNQSFIEWEVDDNSRMQRCFVGPHFMNWAIKYVCPVVSRYMSPERCSCMHSKICTG
jgi:hypothetical protein